jgi:protein-S-isoprenylcysteine O-methyltransferase Ste14
MQTMVNTLSQQALRSVSWFQAFLALCLFVPAWSLRFWEAWLYWVLFSLCVFGLTLYFLKHDPRLIERRLKAGPAAEQQRSQRIIQTFISGLIGALFILPGLDRRFHWSEVPAPLVLLGDAAMVLGFAIVFRVFKENSYTAGTVTVEDNQQVISTGPYGRVRHPMYAGSMLMFLATPLALGSLWDLLPAVAVCGVMIVRLLEEERYLSAQLPGYDAYCRSVSYRLIPRVW